MVPNKNKGRFQPQTQREMPIRFRCKVGGEWKGLDSFSQSQQKLIKGGGKINAAHSGMTCRDHTSKARVELRCDLCGLIKSRDQFSKSSLKREEYKCMRCTAWTETQEPSVTPSPLETGHISAEEERSTSFQNGHFIDSADFFGDLDQIQPPASYASPLKLSDMYAYDQADGPLNGSLSSILGSRSMKGRFQADTVSVSGESVASSSYLPPHLLDRAQASRSEAKSSSSTLGNRSKEGRFKADTVSVSGESRVSPGYLPPHLLGRAQASRSEAKSLPSASSAFGDPPKKEPPPHLAGTQARRQHLNSASSVSTATTVQEAKKSRQIPFNAWDSTGRQYQDFKEPTEGSSLSSAASIASANNTKSNVNNDPNVIGDWDVVNSPEPQIQVRGKGRWPKSSSDRIPESELKKQPVLTHIKARHIDPDVDRQCRMHYCDSDDSDY